MNVTFKKREAIKAGANVSKPHFRTCFPKILSTSYFVSEVGEWCGAREDEGSRIAS